VGLFLIAWIAEIILASFERNDIVCCYVIQV
jgi:hypothetical protein